MTTRALLLHAAELLETEAEVARESCQGNRRLWACDCRRDENGKCNAERIHDDQVETAKKLRQAAKRLPRRRRGS